MKRQKPKTRVRLIEHGSLWGKPEGVAVRANYVTAVGKFTPYDPFSFYYPYGDKLPKGDAESLPYLFADVDGHDPKQVAAFCERFGLIASPATLPRAGLASEDDRPWQVVKSRDALGKSERAWTREDITNTFDLRVTAEPRAYRRVWDQNRQMHHATFIAAQQDLHGTLDLIQVARKHHDKEVCELAQNILDRIFSRKFHGARLHPTYDPLSKSWTVWWDTTSLETIMYVMLMLDMAGPSKIVICPNPDCRAPFLVRHPKDTYCSHSCQNLCNVRRYRARLKRQRQKYGAPGRTKGITLSGKEKDHGTKRR
jgi:hypothetical protein